MDRSFIVVFFVAAILFSSSEATRSFQDILNLALPKSADNPSHPEVPVTEESGDHPKKNVDFGTNGWPYVYYTRRDAKGTIDWGTLSWPYIYYSEKNSKDDVTDSVGPTAIVPGRKLGSGLKP